MIEIRVVDVIVVVANVVVNVVAIFVVNVVVVVVVVVVLTRFTRWPFIFAGSFSKTRIVGKGKLPLYLRGYWGT